MLRMRQMTIATSSQHPTGLPRSQSSSFTNLSQILPYLQNQDSYAAAVKRTHISSTLQITPINYSRSSSPTQFSLTKHLSSLSIQSSKGSSASSTASDSPSERERAQGKINTAHYHQNDHAMMQQRKGGKNPQVSSVKYYRSHQLVHNRLKSSERRHQQMSQHQNRHIPGMPGNDETVSVANGEDNQATNDGGWIKVEYSKKSHQQPVTSKSMKDKSKTFVRVHS